MPPRPLIAVLLVVAACADDAPAVCEDVALPSRPRLGCEDELRAQAARPVDSALPG